MNQRKYKQILSFIFFHTIILHQFIYEYLWNIEDDQCIGQTSEQLIQNPWKYKYLRVSAAEIDRKMVYVYKEQCNYWLTHRPIQQLLIASIISQNNHQLDKYLVDFQDEQN